MRMKTDLIPSQMLLTSPAADTLTREAQGERSRLSGTAYGDIKETVYIGLYIGS